MAGADAVGCVVWAGGDDIWVHGGLHMFSKSSAVSLPDRAILTTTLILFVHILLKKGRESGPTCRDFGVIPQHSIFHHHTKTDALVYMSVFHHHTKTDALVYMSVFQRSGLARIPSGYSFGELLRISIETAFFQYCSLVIKRSF